MSERVIELVNEQDLAAVAFEAPGDGSRLLMCFLLTEHDAGADGVTIVAMAEDYETLLERVRGENLMVERQPSDWRQPYPWVAKFGFDTPRAGTSLLVLDAPPAAIRRICLESAQELEESIEALRRREASSGPTP